MTSPEYTSNLINWLQLLCDGRITAKANIDWNTVIESARIQ